MTEALGKVHSACDMAYSMERVHPAGLGCDVIIPRGGELEIARWWRDERGILDRLLGEQPSS
ncbi:hypothetical protein [Corynebacterium halotolerans]|uniref:hypothetical protein n=1 Tax=Corynebacterium halotolerans TaxID=225326 RepID=UPI003CEBF029